MQKEILLLGKKILVDASPVVLSYQPDENWKEVWEDKAGCWTYEDGYLVGSEPDNKGGILLSRKCFDKDVMLTYLSFSGGAHPAPPTCLHCITNRQS